jgi:hypothetical protein
MNWHQIYSTKELGKCFKIDSIDYGGESQTNERKVFLNETLFKKALFHSETA